MYRTRLSALQALTLIAFSLLGLAIADVEAAPAEVGLTDGKTYSEWSAEWWRWLFSIPAAENPQDLQGRVDCAAAQRGPVWFLAGGDLGVPAVRTCSVPASKKLFFPVLNILVYNKPGERLTLDDKRAQLDEFFAVAEPGSRVKKVAGPKPCGLYATLDGRPVARLTPRARVQSPPFVMDTGDGPFGFQAGLVDRQAVSEGFWVMLPPLAPGEHTLRFGGRFCQGDGLHPDLPPVDVTYLLEVVGKDLKSDDDSDADSDSDSDEADSDSDLSDVEIIESLYEAFAIGDLDTILAIIDEDVVWIESEGIPYGGTFIGRDAVFAGVFGKIAEDWDNFTATVDETFAASGNRVVVRQRDGGIFKATGKSMEAPAISIWTLNSAGRVIQFEQVIDTQEVVSATR